MKKALSLLLVGAMTLSLAACGGNGDSASTDSAAEESTTTEETEAARTDYRRNRYLRNRCTEWYSDRC